MLDLVPILIQILTDYGYIIVFLGTIFAGELVILAAVFLASLGILNIYLVILFGLAGIVVSDNLWYWVGTRLNNRFEGLKQYFYTTKYQQKINSFKNKFDNNYSKFLVMSKFVYGLRVLTILTSGYQKIPYKKFVLFNLIGTLSWMIIIVFLGYVMGVSWHYLGQFSSSARYYVLFGLLILFVLRYIFNKLINFNSDGQRN